MKQTEPDRERRREGRGARQSEGGRERKKGEGGERDGKRKRAEEGERQRRVESVCMSVCLSVPAVMCFELTAEGIRPHLPSMHPALSTPHPHPSWFSCPRDWSKTE